MKLYPCYVAIIYIFMAWVGGIENQVDQSNNDSLGDKIALQTRPSIFKSVFTKNQMNNSTFPPIDMTTYTRTCRTKSFYCTVARCGPESHLGAPGIPQCSPELPRQREQRQVSDPKPSAVMLPR